MNMFRAFMELDKLNESSPSRLSMINDLKSWGKNYKSLEQRSYGELINIWKKEQAAQNEQQAYAEVAQMKDRPACGECGAPLTDGGFCPVCDDGEEHLAEACSTNLPEELQTKPKYAWTEEDWDLYSHFANSSKVNSWSARVPAKTSNTSNKIKLQYACAIEEPADLDDPVFFYYDSDRGDYDYEDLDTAISENPFCTTDSYCEILLDAKAIKPSFSDLFIVVFAGNKIIDCIDTDLSQEFRDFCKGTFKPVSGQIPGHLDSSLYEGFLDQYTDVPSTTSWISRAPTQQQQVNKTASQPSAQIKTTPPSNKIVTIIYDVKAHKLRARANDGVHGWANVAFPNNLRNRDGQQYEVDDLVWNGKNYRAVGNIVAI